MKSNNIDIVKQKKGNIKDLKVRDSLITKFLLPSIFFINKESDSNDVKTSYPFLENDHELEILKKFKKSIPYFELLNNELINKDFIVESDDIFQINSKDLFALQTITEFVNYKFDYKLNKKYYENFFGAYDLDHISNKISFMNTYIKSLENIFNHVSVNSFDIASGFTLTLDEYLNKFNNVSISIDDTVFGRPLNYQDAVKNIKLILMEENKDLANKIKKLELDYYDDKFLIQNDFLEFLYLIMKEIKNIFKDVIQDILINIEKIWNEHESEIKNMEMVNDECSIECEEINFDDSKIKDINNDEMINDECSIKCEEINFDDDEIIDDGLSIKCEEIELDEDDEDEIEDEWIIEENHTNNIQSFKEIMEDDFLNLNKKLDNSDDWEESINNIDDLNDFKDDIYNNQNIYNNENSIVNDIFEDEEDSCEEEHDCDSEEDDECVIPAKESLLDNDNQVDDWWVNEDSNEFKDESDTEQNIDNLINEMYGNIDKESLSDDKSFENNYDDNYEDETDNSDY